MRIGPIAAERFIAFYRNERIQPAQQDSIFT